MTVPSWAGSGADPTRPNAARMYDFLLGGVHNFAVDREAAEQLVRAVPEAVPMAILNRGFLRRAVRTLVGMGVNQFLDLGSGMPTVGAVHQIAHALDGSCRVVYVDVDLVAVEHARALVATDDRVGAVGADLRDVDRVLRDPVTRRLIDFTRPVAVLMLAVLHFIPDADRPTDLVAAYRDATPPGSYLAVTHGSQQGQPEPKLAGMKQGAEVYRRTSTPYVDRDHAGIAAFFAGYDLIPPGLVALPMWRPEEPADEDPPEDPSRFPVLGGVGVLPPR
jgi:hypothetical protein